MSNLADPITVEVSEARLSDLLKRMREEGRNVRIVDHGSPVAELSPLPKVSRLPPIDPKLKATMLVEGHELTNEEDWPEDCR